MVRGFALTVGLLAAVPAVAGEMSAEEARRFVIGKIFSYSCFEGTRGQGRVNADGSVTGSIQFQGSGEVRHAHLPANTLHVADDIFRRVVQQDREAALVVESRNLGARQRLNQQGVLSNGEDVRPLRLPIPAGNARQSVRYILQFDIKRGGVEQVEAPPREHALPCARPGFRTSCRL